MEQLIRIARIGLLKVCLVALVFVTSPVTAAPVFNKQLQVDRTVPNVSAVTQDTQPVVEQPVESVKAPAAVEPPAETPAPQPAVVERPVVEVPKGKEDILRAAQIPESDWQAVDYIVSKESSWRHDAVNSSSGATGLCQALPASKMASEGEDYMTNAVTQLRWCHKYATQRYGSWQGAFAFWVNNHWW